MTNEPKLAPETPAKDAANQSGKPAEATPITSAPAPAPKSAPLADAKKI